ncbi:MAG: ADP-ribosylglycohydrolase family protein, partial [Gammaproteobacteria bacterium]|nr:ADP-ribosylglycohydrolase family protein [Gammaproteobacteria bacterium]
REKIARWYPQGVRGFEGPPGAVIPRYVGNQKREWRIGETTDDTERTLAVARALIEDQAVTHEGVGKRMLGCEKSVHPGVQSLWEFHEANDPGRVASAHDGCGAAIRVAPVGIVYASTRIDDIATAAREVSIPTHGGSYAIAAAAATAAAVAAAVEGASGSEIAGLSVTAAALAEQCWPHVRGPAFAAALRAIRDDLARRDFDAAAIAERHAPVTPLTIVPLALALATECDSATEAILLAANIGGDADSVASIAGAVLGARAPNTIDAEWVAVVEEINGHGLRAWSDDLVALRDSGIT